MRPSKARKERPNPRKNACYNCYIILITRSFSVQVVPAVESARLTHLDMTEKLNMTFAHMGGGDISYILYRHQLFICQCFPTSVSKL